MILSGIWHVKTQLEVTRGRTVLKPLKGANPTAPMMPMVKPVIQRAEAKSRSQVQRQHLVLLRMVGRERNGFADWRSFAGLALKCPETFEFH
jgi:hypothetical protein